MRRPLDDLFTLCSAVSLALAVALVTLWAGSYQGVSRIRWTVGPHRYLITTGAGQFALQWSADERLRGGGSEWGREDGRRPVHQQRLWVRSVTSPQHPFVQRPVRRSRLGFWWGTLNPASPSEPLTFVLIGPLCPFAVLPMVLPAAWIRVVARERTCRMRSARGGCPSCGYDLRASPERCPECGAVTRKEVA